MKFSVPGIGGSLGECIICGTSFAMEVMLGRFIHTISIDGFDCDVGMPVHDKCLTVLQENQNDWHGLPDGPLRQELAKSEAEVERKESE